MSITLSALRSFPGLALLASALAPEVLEGQNRARRDTVIRAHEEYDAGSLHRALFGNNYRDLWAAPIRVPFLDLSSYGGGLTAWKIGGGKATRTLRLLGPDSAQYVFRPLFKRLVDLPKEFKHTIIWGLVLDQRSALHPLAPLAAPAPLSAVRVLHPTPQVVVMPDDPALGEFREEFGGIPGTIEEFPDVAEKGFAWAGAQKIINGDKLLLRINKDPTEHVDARAFLTAHLIDLLLGDADRHADQWKWARMTDGGDWIPIPRDRDMVFVSYEGLIATIGRMVSPALVRFDSTYAPTPAQFHNATEHDRRLLSGLEKPVWDSISAAIVAAVTDSVLQASVNALPPEYNRSSSAILAKLKARRDQIPQTAAAYYAHLATILDLHATDSADYATIVRSPGVVDVQIRSGKHPPYFRRRFNAAETQEIRLYLHDGSDTAVVTGVVQQSIPVRIIGGNGDNVLIDSSRVGGRTSPTHLYDVGHVTGVQYESDSIIELKAEADEGELPFNRLPWRVLYGEVRQPQRDRGGKFTPVIGLKTGHGLGIVPRIGIATYKYGFRKVPYASMMKGEIAYSTTNRFEVIVENDRYFEESGMHIPITASMSQLGIVEFRGFGNNLPELTGSFYDVREREWSLYPGIGFTFGPKSDIRFGAIIRYTSTDSSANRFISQLHPYGFSRFGQAGLRVELVHDTRNQMDTARTRGGFAFNPPDNPTLWGKLELSGSAYPATWDVESAYQELAGVASAYLTIPFATKPVVAMRAGGKKLFGDFPYFDAAFLGGSGSLRTEHRQRWAGDASLFGSTELRVPVAKFPLIVPFNVGLLGFVDVGRVYVDGDSPGGWHKGTGAGLWIGVLRPDAGINITYTNNPDRRVITHVGFTF